MAKTDSPRKVTVQLTPEQIEQIKRVLGREVAEVQLTAEALEERIAPRTDPCSGYADATGGMS